ncbi:RNA 3'-terminal phosphate cyclase domain-containing protein [Hyaloraphidium curvatum]|nr:RNA 3'-terminal phosphate cyclase domain-containing protein [Hyaloraphidium curvatum]
MALDTLKASYEELEEPGGTAAASSAEGTNDASPRREGRPAPPSARNKTIHIDGSQDEGGGQILRNGSSYWSILGVPLAVSSIRKKRDRIGLRPQHLAGLRLLQSISGAGCRGLEVGSTEIEFRPTKLSSGSFVADTGTAGSIVLLIQGALPVLLFAPGDSEVSLRGGTHATLAPPLDYFTDVLLPVLRRFGGFPAEAIELQVISRGYYPKGAGHCVLRVRPSAFRAAGRRRLQALEILDRGEATGITINAFTSGKHSQNTTKARLLKALGELAFRFPGVPCETSVVTDSAQGDDAYGCLIVIRTSTSCRIAGSSLGTFRTKPEDVANSAMDELCRNWAEGGCVDEYLQDQLVIFATLAEGISRYRTGPITSHTRTAMWLAERLCGVKWTVEAVPGTDSFVVECIGLGVELA